MDGPVFAGRVFGASKITSMWSRPQKRVLVTRSREQSSELAAQLEARGLEPIPIPTIAIALPRIFRELDDALAEIGGFDWLLFTSANAVRAFAERGRLHFDGGRPRIAAIGPATARALLSIGLGADLLPPTAVAESLAEALRPHAAGTRMLLVRAETARDVLPETLRAAGADVTVAPAYRNVVPEESIPLLRAMFREPSSWPDAITFSSSSTATNLVALMEAAGVMLPRDGEEGRTIVRASIGPITSETLRELGYAPHVEAAEATVAALAEALAGRLLG